METADASDADSSFSDSESLWSLDDENSNTESGSDIGEEEGDTFLNDSDLWQEEETLMRGSLEAEDDEDSPSDTSKPETPVCDEHPETDLKELRDEHQHLTAANLKELALILPGVDKDAAKKAEEKFKTQQGEEARVRREGGYYLKAMKKEYDARGLIQDEHCLKVLSKLAYLKPEPDGRYKNLMEIVSDTDVLLEAYRRVKAGAGGDPAKVPIHNVNMEWFRETQAKLRDGTFQLRPIKVVEVEKREVARIQRKKKVFQRAYRKKRQPF